MRANKESIESLAPRVKTLAELLCKPVSEELAMENSRRNVLKGWVSKSSMRAESDKHQLLGNWKGLL